MRACFRGRGIAGHAHTHGESAIWAFRSCWLLAREHPPPPRARLIFNEARIARDRYNVPDVFHPCCEHEKSLEAETKAAVSHGAVAT